MSIRGYFLDTSAIAKLYLDEVGSHRMREIFEEQEIVLAYSELSYTESISAFRKIKNIGKISEEELTNIVSSFQQDFFNVQGASNRYPISLSDIVFQAPDVMLKAHKLKDEINQSLQYIKSLDTLQLTSWVHMIQNGVPLTFVTSDSRLANIAATYKDSQGWDAQVIDLSACACEICSVLRESDRAAS